MSERKGFGILKLIGPGILIAATGVGAGDLAAGAIAGSKIGYAVLYAVIVGAFLKFVLNEGLTRWQLVTGETLLEGSVRRLGKPFIWIFMTYLLLWTVQVGGSLMGACGVAGHAILPLVNPNTDKIIYGILHSAVAVILVRRGGYQLFEKVMSVCIALMFVTVILTAIAVGPDWAEVAKGLFVPAIPMQGGETLEWTIALLGGVGGTLTVICYGYWIREENRTSLADLKTCRVDLAGGYFMTAIFGMAVVVIASGITVSGSGSRLIVQLADSLEQDLGTGGTVAKWAFLIGAWGAVASSLLGVWQSVPYVFADMCRMIKSRNTGEPAAPVETSSRPYRLYLYALATIPIFTLWISFTYVQKVNSIFGALFIPFLAILLLILNGNKKVMGEHRNSIPTTIVLCVAILIFLFAGFLDLKKKVFPAPSKTAEYSIPHSSHKFVTGFHQDSLRDGTSIDCVRG